MIEINAMRPLKLYLKTSLPASLITLLMFVALLGILSVRIASLIQEKEIDLARLQVSELAEQIERISAQRDSERLRQSANLIQSGHPNVTAVRVWQVENNDFTELASADESLSAQPISEKNQAALRDNQITETEAAPGAKSIFRVFAPLREPNGKVFGAVEVAQILDSPWTIAAGYAQSEIGLALAAVVLITLVTYLLFRYLVYRPIALLTEAMEQAETGNLAVQAPIAADDELGKVAAKFNRMVASLNEMTKERAAHQEILQARVTEATAELQTKNEQLSDANRELWRVSRHLSEVERLAAAGQTAAQFAHEVGTPLNLISGHVQLLRLKLKDENSARLEIISEQIERIERIVRAMLDRTKLTTGERHSINLNKILRRTFEATAPLLAEKKVKLVADFAENLPPISGDGDHLQQIFINLTNNALDAMPAGGALKVETKREENHALVMFSDDGTGMSEEVRDRIFDLLYTTKGARGNGLGLVVVRQIMQEHNGEIEVESAPGKGTCFRLRFPVSE